MKNDAFAGIQRRNAAEIASGILAQAGAVLANDHFVYASDKHGSKYVNKDAVYTSPHWLDQLCKTLASWFYSYDIDVVAAPAIGGVNIATSTARLLHRSGRDIRCIYAEREETSLVKAVEEFGIEVDVKLQNPVSMTRTLNPGDELLIKKPTFVIKRGYDKLVEGKRVLVVEDILTTGMSARNTVRAVRGARGSVVAVGAFCNRGGVTAETLEAPELFALMDVKMEMYAEDECPLCAAGVPVNTEYGKGKAFLARKQQEQGV